MFAHLTDGSTVGTVEITQMMQKIEPCKLQKVILQNQKSVHEPEAETKLTELFVNIIDFVFRRAVLLSEHK